MAALILIILAAQPPQKYDDMWPAQGMILVSHSGADAVGVIDPGTATVNVTIPVATNPHEIAISKERTRALVATTGGRPGSGTSPSRNVVTLLDLEERRALPPIDLGKYETPHDVRLSADGRIAWIACAPSQAVVEIDVGMGAILTAWPTKTEGGWFVAATPDGSKLYVPHLEGRRVTVIDRLRKTVSTVLEGGAQSGIDVAPDGGSVWVIDHERQAINVIDTGTDRAVARISLRSNAFGRLRFTPDGSRVIVVQGKSLLVIDSRSRQLTGEMELPYEGKVVDVSPAGARAAVSHPADDRVSIIDLGSLKVVASVRTGKAPDGVAWVK